MSGTPGYVRWQPAEWLKVAVNMLPLLEKGDTRLVALARSMRRCLGKDRHKEDEWIHRTSAAGNTQMNEYLQKARNLSDEERALHTVLTPAQQYALDNPDNPVKPRKPAPPRKKLDEGRNYKGNFRWTTLEKAKIVRMVKWFQEHGVTTSLGRMMVEAQELVLPPDRRRAVAGIMQANHGGGNVRTFADGEANLWLLKDVPFNPPIPPGAEATEAASDESTPPPPSSDSAMPLAGPESIIPGSNASAVTLPHTDAPALAPTGTLREAMNAAVAEFGDTLREAMDKLLLTHTAIVVHQLQGRIEATARQTAQEMAALIETGIAGKLRGVLLEELGGPSTTPPREPADPGKATATPVYAPPPPEEPAAPAEAAPKSRQLKVDVVGLNTPALEELVRKGFGPEVDLRFFDPDSSGSYAPHKGRECIMVTHRIPHALKDKIRAAKVEPLYVKPTVGHVVHAIEELQRAQHIAAAAHHH